MWAFARGTLLITVLLGLTACGQPPLRDSDDTPVEAYWELVEIAEPVYPEEAAEKGLEGYVSVRVLIGRDGRIQQINVLDSSPDEVFVPSVLEALHAFRYEPTEGNPERQRMFSDYLFEFEPE